MSADLGGWLQQIGFGQYAEALKREQIDIEAARHLIDANLKDLGLPMGHRVKFLAAMAAKSRMRESCTSGSVRVAPWKLVEFSCLRWRPRQSLASRRVLSLA